MILAFGGLDFMFKMISVHGLLYGDPSCFFSTVLKVCHGLND